MKTTNTSTVELIDHMGSDLTVVNAARVSFDKESSWEYINPTAVDEFYLPIPEHSEKILSKQDEKLIQYLAKHNHWSPFAHTSIQLRINAPIFVARQLVKHQVGGVWNEVSRRYVDDEPTFFFPEKWRWRAENVKQGSGEDTNDATNKGTSFVTTTLCSSILEKYNILIEAGIAPEQARIILPQNMMTSWYWTGSLKFFHRVFMDRTGVGAQQETKDVAIGIGKICNDLFPTSWQALTQKD